MEDNFYKDDFEQFLKEQADSHRLYPSDSTWRNIHKQLHHDKNWPALTIAAFTLLIATVAICVHFAPKQNIFAITTPPPAKVLPANAKSNLSTPTAFLSPDDRAVLLEATNWKKGTSVASTNTETALTEEQKAAADMEARMAANATANDAATTGNFSYKVVAPSVNTSAVIEENGATVTTDPPGNDLTVNAPAITENEPSTSPATTPKAKPVVKSEDDDRNVADEYLKQHKEDLGLFTKKKGDEKANKFSYQVYITPSISYRRLKEDRTFLKGGQAGPVALNYVADVHQIVRHKPGTGLEAGFAVMYAVTPTLRVKSGIQFNVRQYNIEAYRGNTELTTIALMNNGFIDSVSSYSVYRTSSGYQAEVIGNRYYQVSIPIGVDLRVFGNERMSLNFAGTVQPTYMINRNAYMLTSNFKNYTESTEMVQSWNLNTSIEAYLNFKIGDYNWQLGPQIRYQHLPTMIPQYPIREHLLDYGIKLGVTKPLY